MSSRIQQLEAFVHEDPDDPFNLYALALEHVKSDCRKAIDVFIQLLKMHPDYIPTYYQLGKLYIEFSENERALEVFDQGIRVTTEKKDYKALREIQAARQELLSDLED